MITTFPRILSLSLETIWLHAWTAVILGACGQCTFSLVSVAFILLAGAMISRLVSGRGYRMITLLLLHGTGSALAVLGGVWTVLYRQFPLISPNWLHQAVTDMRTPVTLLFMILIISISLALWVHGAWVGSRDNLHEAVMSSIDRCFTLLFFLFLLKLIVTAKGYTFTDTVDGRYAVAFLCSTVAALGTIRCTNIGSGRLRDTCFFFGCLGIFACACLSAATALATLFTPSLHDGADKLYGVIKTASSPLGMVIQRFLRFFIVGLGHQAVLPPTPERQPSEALTNMASSATNGVMETVLTWVTVFLVISGGILMALLLLYFLFSWLLSRGNKRRPPQTGIGLGKFLRRLVSYLGYCISLLRRGHQSDIAGIYRRLLIWGNRRGVTKRPSETPCEYGLRLSRRFPAAGNGIDLIVGAYNATVYGGDSSAPDKTGHLLTALRNCGGHRFLPFLLRRAREL